jgi:DNA-binding NarL/FixJ family response regulator
MSTTATWSGYLRRVHVRVVIADDQPLMRTGLRKVLESEPGIEVAGEAADGREAFDLVRHRRPDVALMDIRMPILDGLEATRRIVALGIDTRVLILTTYDLDEYVFAALRAGASGFLLKDRPPEELLAAIGVVIGGDALLSPSITRRLVQEFARRPGAENAPPALGELTPRELEVLRLVARGRSNREVADILVIAEATVKTHVGSLLGKLGLRDRVQAVVFAYEHAIVTPGSQD